MVEVKDFDKFWDGMTPADRAAVMPHVQVMVTTAAAHRDRQAFRSHLLETLRLCIGFAFAAGGLSAIVYCMPTTEGPEWWVAAMASVGAITGLLLGNSKSNPWRFGALVLFGLACLGVGVLLGHVFW